VQAKVLVWAKKTTEKKHSENERTNLPKKACIKTAYGTDNNNIQNTMGRPPSLGAAQRRPTRARIIVTDPSSPDDAAAAAVLTSPATPSSATSPNSVSSPQFPRRAPRTGTAYQHKVPAYEPNNGQDEVTSSRPAPLLMSQDVPHETASSIEQSLLATSTTTTTGTIIIYVYLSESRSWALQDPCSFSEKYMCICG
jgi:hypothetical protein